MMKVLFLTNMYPTPDYPFFGIFVKEQVESLRKVGIDVDIFFINGRKNRFNYLLAVPRLVRKLRSDHYDIVHSHHTYCIYPFWFAEKILDLKIPIILTLHEAEVLKSAELRPSDIDIISKLIYSKRIKEWALQKVDLVISVCEHLLRALNFDGRAMVLPPGVDLELFRPLNKFKCREKLKLPKDKKILFFPADADNPKAKTQKGFDVLKNALVLLKSKDTLLLTGGNIFHNNMPTYMNAADVVIQTSNFEASPMVIKEAMACNVSIVSTDVGDSKDVIGDTKGCFICEREFANVARKIEIALEFAKRTKGRNRIEKLGLGLQQIARNINKVYKKVLRTYEKERREA